MTKSPPPSPYDKEMPFVQHLLELRDRLLKMLLAIGIILLMLLPFTNQIFTLLTKPLMRFLPANTQMIAIEVASPFLTPFKLLLVVSICLAVPVILYHMWAFVAPGLYQHEKKIVFPLLVASTALFYIGMLFAYYVVLPLVFRFMVSTTPENVTMMTDIRHYLDFVLVVFMAFGTAFQVPIATIILIWMDIVSRETLMEKRPYIIVAAFVIGMILTPPDVISQTLLAVPMWLLFEAGLFFSRFVKAKEDQEGASHLPVNKQDT